MAAALAVALAPNVDEVRYELGMTELPPAHAAPLPTDGDEPVSAEDTEAASATPKQATGRFAVAGAGRVVIPKIGVDIPVGVEEKTALKRGAWLQSGSAQPDQPGNVVLAGHRRRGAFTLLHRLARGDEVTVLWSGQTYRYKVKSVREVEPDDTSQIARAGPDRLTLYTCTPSFLGDRRVVVVALPAAE